MAAILAQDKALAERKELARKQKEKAMAQMQNMQRKFLEKNREQMLDREGPEVDEPYVSASFIFLPLFSIPSAFHLLPTKLKTVKPLIRETLGTQSVLSKKVSFFQ